MGNYLKISSKEQFPLNYKHLFVVAESLKLSRGVLVETPRIFNTNPYTEARVAGFNTKAVVRICEKENYASLKAMVEIGFL